MNTNAIAKALKGCRHITVMISVPLVQFHNVLFLFEVQILGFNCLVFNIALDSSLGYFTQ